MALKTTNKNRIKPSVVESKIELKSFKEENYYNSDFFKQKINYKFVFSFLIIFAVISVFVL